MLRRHCLALDLKDDPAVIAEYDRYHRAVWPEILQSLRDAGINDMEIYRIENRLFMIIDVTEVLHSKRSRPPTSRAKSSKSGNTDGKFSAAVALGEVRRKMAPHDARFFAKGFLTPRHHFLPLLAKPVNSQPHHISRPQIHGRLLPSPTPGGVPVEIIVARLQAHEPAQIAHQMSRAEHHRSSSFRPDSAFPSTSSHKRKFCGSRNFVSRHQPRPNRTKCIGAFPLHPFAPCLPAGTRARINRSPHNSPRHTKAPLAPPRISLLSNHQRPVQLPNPPSRAARNHHFVIRSANRRTSLSKQDRFRRNFHPGLCRMIRMSSANANKFSDRSHARPNPRRTLHQRQPARIDRVNFFSDAAKRFACNVRTTAQIPDLSSRIYQTGPLRPAFPYRTSFTLVSSRNAPLRRGSLAALQARKCSKLVPHRPGAAESIIVSTIPLEDSCSHRMMRHNRVPNVPKSNASLRAIPKKLDMWLFESGYSAFFAPTTPWTQPFRPFPCRLQKFRIKTKFVSESRDTAAIARSLI